MPPKKRNRDLEVEPDPDQLDKDELKGMLRQSLGEKAELVAKMEQQKREFEGKLDQQKAELVNRKFISRSWSTRWSTPPSTTSSKSPT